MKLNEPCFDCVQDLVSYRSYQLNYFELRRYFGKYVVLLLPDDWGHDRGLTDEERRVFLDEADLIYEYFYQLYGAEPEGEGHLQIAFVEDGYALPWALRGRKRIEIKADQRNMEMIRYAQAEGVTYLELVEQMARAFERHWRADSWLERMTFAVGSYYSRTPRSGLTADEQLQAMVRYGFMPYVWDLSVSWQRCFVDRQCSNVIPIGSSSLAAGFSNLVALHHGDEAMFGSIAFIIDLLAIENHWEIDLGDMRIESLAHGAQADLGCYVDILRWYASDEVRERMSTTYSSASQFCADADSDSYSVFEGDCNDSSRDVRPHEIETVDGVDEDCDGVVDDLVLNEPVRGDFVDPVPVSAPIHIFGRVEPAEVADIFELEVDAGAILRFELCNEHRKALYPRLIKDGVATCDGFRWSRFGCHVWRNEFTESGTWYLEVREVNRYNSDSYSLLIHETELPVLFRSRVEVERVGEGSYLFTAVSNLESTAVPADMVRFWVSGFGFIADLPWQPVVSYEWQPGIELEDRVYSVRAQVFRDGRPFSEISDRAYLGRSAVDFTWSFAGPPTNQGQPVRLEDRSQGSPQALTWRIGDAVVSGESSLVHTFRGGRYEVALEATNSFGSAVRTREINIPDGSPTTVRVTATIYGKNRLSLRGNTARWQYLGEAAERSWESKQPMVINGGVWYPSWPLNAGFWAGECHGESDVFDRVEPPLAVLPATSVAVTETSRGRNVIVIEQPSAENDYTLVLELTPPLDGSGTVDFKARIKWQQPAPRRARQHH
jgi:stalled ribosome alternative rescue factor ArfA